MEMSEIRAALPNCPNCGRHCPIDALNCSRGRELLSRILSGLVSLEEVSSNSASHSGKEKTGSSDAADRHHRSERHHHHHDTPGNRTR